MQSEKKEYLLFKSSSPVMIVIDENQICNVKQKTTNGEVLESSFFCGHQRTKDSMDVTLEPWHIVGGFVFYLLKTLL